MPTDAPIAQMSAEELTYAFMHQLAKLRRLANDITTMDIDGMSKEDRAKLTKEYLVLEANLTLTVQFLRLSGADR